MPTMHKFRKKIVSPGNHNVVKNGSTREFEAVTPDRIRHWVEVFNEMKHDGLLLPNPFVHYDENGRPPLPVTISERGELLDPTTGKPTLWNAALNGGFWDDLEVDEEGCLWGVVESPGDPDDPNTPAGKLSTTIRETSVGIAKEYPAGNGKVYRDCPVHITSCVKAVEANQENFIPQSEGEFSMFSMSTLIDNDSGKPGNTGETETSDSTSANPDVVGIPQLVKLLKEFAIDLPEDTSQDNLIERLVLVCRQKIADQEEQEENLTPPPPKPAKPQTQPQNSTEKSGIVTMSQQVAEPTKDEGLSLSMVMSVTAKNLKKSIKDRLKAQVDRGVLKQEIADKLFDGVDMLTMSVDDFDKEALEFRETKYEFALTCLEAIELPAKGRPDLSTMTTELTNGYAPEGAVEHSQQMTDEPTDEEVEAFTKTASGDY